MKDREGLFPHRKATNGHKKITHYSIKSYINLSLSIFNGLFHGSEDHEKLAQLGF